MTAAKRFPELDSLRGLAAFAVIGYHLVRQLRFPEGAAWNAMSAAISFNGHGGRLGVIFFFVLSGYLITQRMLLEHRAGRFGFRRFMVRRALRIWPLYYAVLVLGFAVIPWAMHVAGHAVPELPPWWLYALFLANFSMLHCGDPMVGTLGVQWTVAIEEQFYLCWAALLVLVRHERVFIACVALIAVGSIAHATWTDDRASFFHLFSNLRYLAVGALLGALVARRREQVAQAIGRVSAPLRGAGVVLLPIVLFALFVWAGYNPQRVALCDAIAVLGFCLLLIERSFAAPGMLRLDAIRPLPWLGERSYGLYLLHMPAIALARWATDAKPEAAWMAAIMAVVLAIVFADIAYRIIERPFLRMKARFS